VHGAPETTNDLCSTSLLSRDASRMPQRGISEACNRLEMVSLVNKVIGKPYTILGSHPHVRLSALTRQILDLQAVDGCKLVIDATTSEGKELERPEELTRLSACTVRRSISGRGTSMRAARPILSLSIFLPPPPPRPAFLFALCNCAGAIESSLRL